MNIFMFKRWNHLVHFNSISASPWYFYRNIWKNSLLIPVKQTAHSTRKCENALMANNNKNNNNNDDKKKSVNILLCHEGSNNEKKKWLYVIISGAFQITWNHLFHFSVNMNTNEFHQFFALDIFSIINM